MKNTQTGAAALWIILALVFILLVAGGAWFFVSTQQSNPATSSPSPVVASSLPSATPSQLILSSPSPVANADVTTCLPADVSLDNQIVFNGSNVGEALRNLHANCGTNDFMRDSTGKTIVFYELPGCWNMQSDQKAAMVQKYEPAVREIEKKYSVIEIVCNSNLIP